MRGKNGAKTLHLVTTRLNKLVSRAKGKGWQGACDTTKFVACANKLAVLYLIVVIVSPRRTRGRCECRVISAFVEQFEDLNCSLVQYLYDNNCHRGSEIGLFLNYQLSSQVADFWPGPFFPTQRICLFCTVYHKTPKTLQQHKKHMV